MSVGMYGEAVVEKRDDGRVVLTRADQTVGISMQLLAEADPAVITVDPAGHLVLAGQAAYRPIGFAGGRILDAGGPMLVLVCEKVW